MKTGIILCARANSQRFPHKILQNIGGKSWITQGVLNLCRAGYPIFISIPFGETILAEHLKEQGFKYTMSSDADAEDVLKRMKDIAVKNKLDAVIRVTHDDAVYCDTELIKAMVKYHYKYEADHTNCPSCPRGEDSEIISTKALILAEEMTRDLGRREHITYYVKKAPFKWQEFPYNYRLAFDFPEDWKILKQAWDYRYSRRKFFYDNPELIGYNKIPKVSVIITCHNYGKYLDQCLRSVYEQTYKDFEIIVVNDGSTDETAKVLETHNDIRVITHVIPQGLTISSNEAIKQSKGDYILRLDADDWLHEDALAVMVGYLNNRPDIAMVVPDFTEYHQPIKEYVKCSSIDLPYPHPSCSLMRRGAWNNIRYDENLMCRDGVDFYIRFKQSFGVGYLPISLWYYRRHENTLSCKKDAMKVEREILKKALEGLWNKNK